MASFGYLVIRGLFGMAEHLAPRLGGRAAFELFCRTPNPARLTEKERRIVESARSFMIEARRHCLTTKFGNVTVHEFRQGSGRSPRPTALVIHGWKSRTEHMRGLIETLRAEGFRVLAIDLPGHGQSPGRRLHMAAAVAAVHETAKWFGPFDIIVGHSFGGAVAVNAVAGSVDGVPPIEAGRLVLIAAPSSMPAVFEDFGRFLGLGPRTQTAVADEVQRIAGHPLEDYVGAVQLAGLAVPALVIHAPDDKEVAPRDAEAFAKAGPHVRLFWAPGRGHRRIIADPEILAQVRAFATGEPWRIVA